MAVKAGKCGLHHAVTVYPQRACYQHSTGMNVLSMQIARPHSPLLNLPAVCRRWKIADSLLNRFTMRSSQIESSSFCFFFFYSWLCLQTLIWVCKTVWLDPVEKLTMRFWRCWNQKPSNNVVCSVDLQEFSNMKGNMLS